MDKNRWPDLEGRGRKKEEVVFGLIPEHLITFTKKDNRDD